ncbi:DUF5691 domain-containing protein [Planctomicrobium sp. SH664]|uniref:DUF5691 domain-containing protein n=1 Tax=Planctomicrobium sp. SH664 TaxID=3448125 RepID=UPI003F5BDF6C
MNPLAKAALVGTARHPEIPLDVHDGGEQLLVGSPFARDDLFLLLRAGIAATRQRAGYRPDKIPPLEPAPIDPQEVQEPARLEMLRTIFALGKIELIPEVSLILQQQNLTFPAELLPTLLNLTEPKLRNAVRGALGSRAAWLSRFHSGWEWITSDLAVIDPVQLRQTWDEGSLAERVAALNRLREVPEQSAHALEGLQETFNSEKAESRRRLLEALRSGLSAADLPFLKEVRKDRSETVRKFAQQLELLIPESELAHELWQTARTLLSSRAGMLGGNKIEAVLPEQDSPLADRSATGAAPQGVGERAWWLRNWLSLVSPQLWVQQFQLAPADLVRGALKGGNAEDLLAGWTKAVLRFHNVVPQTEAWLLPLWEAWMFLYQSPQGFSADIAESITQLSRLLSTEQLTPGLMQLLKKLREVNSHFVPNLLEQIARPWSLELSRAYLHLTREVFKRHNDSAAIRWAATLSFASVALAPQALEEALQPWTMPPGNRFLAAASLERELQKFGEVVRLRRDLHQLFQPV